MVSFRSLAALAVVVAAVCVAAAADVVTLTKSNFDETIAKEKLVLVKFFAPWCGHCKAMAEDFKSAATELKGQAVLADVDATIEEDLAKKYNIQGFPTLKVFADGQELTDYNGGRDKESMVKFVQRATLAPYTEVAKPDDYNKFVAAHTGKNFLVGVGLGDTALAAFKKATFALRDIMPDTIEFAHAADNAALEKKIDGVATGDIYLLVSDGEKGEVKPVKYNAETSDSIEAFVKKAALPVFQELTQSNAEMYTEIPHPLVLGFFDDCTGDECQTLEKIAHASSDVSNLAFAWVNQKTLESFVEYVGLKDAEIKICAYSFADDARYLLPEGFKMSEENLAKWVADLKDGKVDQARKSQAIPETQDGPTYTVVGDSWATEVAGAGKDVFIVQVAEWCGHCNAFKPILSKVAEELSKAGVDHVRIALMDSTENDAPAEYKAKGFPTVHFFPAGKGEGVEYDGERTSKGVIDWIKERTTKKFEFDTDSLGEDPKPEEPEDQEGESEDEEGEPEDDDDMDDEDFGDDEGDEGEEGDDVDLTEGDEDEGAEAEAEKEEL